MIPDARRAAGRRFLALATVVLLALTALRLVDPGPLSDLRHVYFDHLQRLSPRAAQPLPVRVVDIDEASLAELGQWPWPRDLHARLVERLWDAGVAVIAFDVLFSEPDRLSPGRIADEMARRGLDADGTAVQAFRALDNDADFAWAMMTRSTVLGTALVAESAAGVVTPKAGFVEIGEFPSDGLYPVPATSPILDSLAEAAEGIGMVSVAPEASGAVTRAVPLAWRTEHGLMPALSLEALRVALGQSTVLLEGAADAPGAVGGLRLGDFAVPTTSDGRMWLHYRPDDPALYVSAARVIAGDLTPAEAEGLQGAIVFVGTSAAGLLDIHRTALGQSVPGVSIHAQIVEQILTGDFLRRDMLVAGAEIVLLVLLCVFLTAAFAFAGPITSFLCGAISTAGVLAASWVLFTRHGMLFDATYPMGAGLLMFTVMAAWQFLVADRDKRALRRSFARYVSDDVLDEMDRAGHRTELGGVLRPATVMFSDVRGFTPLAETMTPPELVTLLNEMFTALGDEILAERGTIDKFIGDAIMAFWNAPLDQPDHARRAALAALGMRAALSRFNAARGASDIALAIGLASGQVLVGNIGSRDRFNYSAIGETVNLASRIETACRHVDYDILTAEATNAAADDLATLFAGHLALKGVSRPVATFIVPGDADLARTQAFQDLSARHGDLVAQLAAGADASAALSDCRALAPHVEPGLLRFYDRLPARTADFAPLCEKIAAPPVRSVRAV